MQVTTVANNFKPVNNKISPVYVAIPDKSKAIAAQGRFTREHFSYDAQQDHYTCPQNNTLSPCSKQQKNIHATKAKPPIAASVR